MLHHLLKELDHAQQWEQANDKQPYEIKHLSSVSLSIVDKLYEKFPDLTHRIQVADKIRSMPCFALKIFIERF